MFNAGAAIGSLGIDTSGFEGGLLRAEAVSALFPSVVTNFLANPLLGWVGVAQAAGTAVVAAVKAAFAEVAAVAAEFDDLGESAQQVGVSARFLREVGAAAADAGSSMAGVADALKFLGNNAADAAAGGEVAKAFADIGVSATDGAGKIKDSETLFYEVADAIAAIEDPAKRTQAAMNLMGRGGTELIPLMMGGAAGVRDAARAFTEFSGQLPTERLERAGGAFQSLKQKAADFGEGLGRALALPVLEWFQENQERILDLFREIWPEARSAAEAIGGSLAAGLQAAMTVGEALLPVIEALIKALGLLAQVGGFFFGLVGQPSPEPPPVAAVRPTATAAVGGGPMGGRELNFSPTVNVNFDPAGTGRALGDVVERRTREAWGRVASAADTRAVQGGL